MVRRACCPACGHVVAVSGGPRFYQVHEHTVDGEALAFVHRGDVACAGSGDYVSALWTDLPAHRTRYDGRPT